MSARSAGRVYLVGAGPGDPDLITLRGAQLLREAAAIGHAPTRECVLAERAVLVRLGADCNVPLAAHAQHTPRGTLRLRALLAASDGARILRVELEGAPGDAEALGERAAEQILRDGGQALLAQLRAGAFA